ncbi:hypothetical protein M9458_047113, partial [Cirrhinus mrigala]
TDSPLVLGLCTRQSPVLRLRDFTIQRTVPQLPASITELLLQNNFLTTITPGHLDQLHHLQLVDLSGNPFHCDCSIHPAELAQRPIDKLTDADFASCVSDHCSGNSTFILGIDERHTGFEAESLRSLKPKHRMRMRVSIGSLSPVTDDTDKPLLNMEILPQILDVLHKQHNIKIK